MSQGELNSLAVEFFSPDFPGVFEGSFNGGEIYQFGKLSRGFIETEQIVGVRTTFLCPLEPVEEIAEGDEIEICKVNYKVEAVENEGIAMVRFILSRC